VSLTQPRTVVANYIPKTFDLSVSEAGAGSGTVTSQPVGIDCGTSCVDTYAYGAVITLTAAADPSSAFSGWSGSGCSGTGTCQVAMTQTHLVKATFTGDHRPDSLLSLGVGRFVGDNVYSATGAGESRSARLSRGKTATLHWRVQNDGGLSDVLALKGRGDSQGFTVRFLYGGADVTRAVVAGTYTKSLAPGASFTMTVKIRVASNASLGSMKVELMRATSLNAPLRDAVIAMVKAVR
jgi:hypothetical protein